MASVIKAGNATDGVQVTSDNTGILELKTGTGAGTTAVTIGTDQSVTFAGAISSSGNQTVTGNLTVDGNTTLGNANTDTILMTAAPSIGGAGLGMGFGFRNRIINGAMVIDQRNASVSVAISGNNSAYSVDRWQGSQNTDGAFTLQQITDAPAGFTNSLRFTTTTADASLGATQFAIVRQAVEGFNFSDFGFGAAGASNITLSFWTKSSLTGTFGGALLNSAENRSYPFSYTINAANTWEQKTVTITGDTTGTWLTNNGVGCRLVFGLGVGSSYSSTAGTWTSTQFTYSVTSAVSVIGTLNATWQITGVQLEKGSTATSFDYRPYGTELQLAQRYCVVFGGAALYEEVGQGPCNSTTLAQSFGYFPTQMRTQATMTWSGNFRIDDGYVQSTAVTAIVVDTNFTGTKSFCLSLTSSSLTAGRQVNLQANNSLASKIIFSAEL